MQGAYADVNVPARGWLRVEALVIFGACLALYGWLGGGWTQFALLFLVPDISFTGYLAGSRAGALVYNAFHTYAATGCHRHRKLVRRWRTRLCRDLDRSHRLRPSARIRPQAPRQLPPHASGAHRATWQPRGLVG